MLIEKRVYYKVTTAFTRKSLLAEATDPYYEWFKIIKLSKRVIFEF